MSQEPERAAVTAASGELPPAKRKKKDPSITECSPAVPTMATTDWSTPPYDLVRRIADSFLATNDLDWYMDYRAVCSGWRAATDDPRSDASDSRLRPRRWIVLDEVFQSQGKEMLLLNIDTGRFLRKNLPQLGDYHAVATTHSDYLVLAEKGPLHAARVLNPLTGVVIPFAAPVPPDVGIADVTFPHGTSLRLAVFCDSSGQAYAADPHSESFIRHEYEERATYDFFRKAAVGGVYARMPYHALLSNFFSSNHLGDPYSLEGFLVGLDGHVCVVLKILDPGDPHGEFSLSAFQFDTETGMICRMKTTGRFAIFIGDHRCLAVDTDKFPGTEANCVYYTEHQGHICKCNIKDGKMEKISEAADFVKQDKEFVLVADRPCTIIHFLASYTVNIPDSQLALQQIP
ncbi:hypothetical protein ACQJBY_029739 [Aegilops geniculata]